ncbi:alkaline phosphatase [uncultured Sunxiuqinia sp.]|uniref:alkaline phosphatase n=1 Tax=uncultured Sunxiuqinia sp. TaxID=1573825 RepID=UPI00262DC3FE|nr:alkaline phosphatase [uncultured Sunxiuqinia sp.]
MKNLLLIVVSFLLANSLLAQENYKTLSKEDSLKIYIGQQTYEVKTYVEKHKAQKPKNIIFMIGDGMGVSQVQAGLSANGGQLFLTNFKHVGFSQTSSASNYVTDSAAGGTALSSGYKTYNGAIGVDTDTIAQPTILEKAEDKGLGTGLVSSSAITHATPASFIAHQPSRSMYEAIAADFLKTDIDVFIGGGYKHFTDRKDGRNLTTDLEKKGYTVLQDINQIEKFKSGKLAGLTAPEHNGRAPERNGMLPKATSKAIELLSKSKDGFFLMVEGSQIDWGGHQNNTIYVVEEVLDFDQCIAQALEFAAKDKETLIVVTADHETGGMGINNGNTAQQTVKGGYTTGGHTGVMVPVFAFGPGAEEFTGIMQNTDIPKKMMKLLGL